MVMLALEDLGKEVAEKDWILLGSKIVLSDLGVESTGGGVTGTGNVFGRVVSRERDVDAGKHTE